MLEQLAVVHLRRSFAQHAHEHLAPAADGQHVAGLQDRVGCGVQQFLAAPDALHEQPRVRHEVARLPATVWPTTRAEASSR